MSAREWYKCPFCKSDAEKIKEEYGKLPVKEFIKKYGEIMQSENYDTEEQEIYETVRMDGEEWLDDDGNWKIEHGLNCNNCGREWDIKISVKPTKDNKKNRKLIFKIPSKSKEFEHHEVKLEGGEYKCDCIGFKTRNKCSHIDKCKEIYKIEKNGK